MKNHFILTRFNLRLWTEDKHGETTQTEEWLNNRFDLFEKYCLPSVKAQTCKDFTWLILLDRETPEVYKQRIHNDVDCMQNVKCIWVNPQYSWNFVRIFGEVINKYKSQAEPRIITSYLDNDDSINVDYVKTIQDIALTLKPNTFITYTYGLQYYVEDNYCVKERFPNNHFISLLEFPNKGELVRTVYGYGGHGCIYRIKDSMIHIKEIDDKNTPGWLEVIHTKNIDNDVRMRPNVRAVTDSFALKRIFGLNILVDDRRCVFFFKYLPRLFKQLYVKWRKGLYRGKLIV
jgi:hypothetical protein